MRDVNYGWLMRYMHANGASMFFIAVYIHMFRGLYYGILQGAARDPVDPRLRHLSADDGHRLHGLRPALGSDELPRRGRDHQPVRGHSRWSAMPSPPGCGGGFAVDNPTLNRFFSLHLPAALHDRRRRRPAHLGPACDRQQQPDRRRTVKVQAGHLPFHPYYTVKDGFAMSVFLHDVSRPSCSTMPNALGHADNYIEANPLVTPAHIVPEWYYLPFYAILRAVPDKLGGVADAMFGAIGVLFALPWLDTSKVRSMRYRPDGQAVLHHPGGGVHHPRLSAAAKLPDDRGDPGPRRPSRSC